VARALKQYGNPDFLQMAITLATENVRSGSGGPFAALIVIGGSVIATGVNRVTATNDPTAHAEVLAIRNACRELGSFQLDGCEIYTSCEPCPMCLGAIYWARLKAIYYANSSGDAARFGFDDLLIYRELQTAPAERRIPMLRIPNDKATESFEAWDKSGAKMEY
jgi:guanine deaminase